MIKYNVIREFASKHPSKPALVYGDDVISWYDFMRYTNLLIQDLTKEYIFKDGVPCLFLSKNTSDVVLLGAAFASIGVPFSGVDYNLDIWAIQSIIKQLNVEHVFVSRDMAWQFSWLSDMCNLHVLDDCIEYVKSIHEKKIENVPDLPHKKFISYSFSSGTTGNPKIIYRTSSFDARRFDYLINKYSFDSSDVHLASLPMYHVSTTGWLRLFLSIGCTVVIHNHTNGYDICELLYRNKISTSIMSPVMLKTLTNEIDDNSKAYFPNLRFIMIGGKNCAAHLKFEAIRKLGDIIHEYYGSTETGVNTLIDSLESTIFPGSVGREFEGNKILIVDAKNKEMLPMEIGKIAISSYMNMDSYVNHASNFIWIENEKYILTSDYGYKNHEGYLYIVQRSSVEITQAYNFYGIENDVLSLNYISDVFAYGLKGINDLKVNVVPNKYIPYAQICADVREIVKKYGIRAASVNVLSNLEYTKTGKVKLLASM